MPKTNRRTALKLGALGLAGIAAPALATEAQGFTHCVASGEPGASRVLLWTRFVGLGATPLRWEVSETENFARIAAHGECLASPASDSCAKAWATGLRPGRWYYYRFIAPSGAHSPVGRTRTLPQGRVPRFKIAVFSCSNMGFGWFNAYAHAAEAGDFDLAVHLGDYFYEQRRGTYPSASQAAPGREQPLNEAIALADYRQRFATYRADPDLQRIHQQLPMIAMWDDHETANDTWAGGAQNHQAEDGDWATRKAASERAYREWLPVSDDYYAAYEVGQLATLFRLETRHLARSKQLDQFGTWQAAPPDQRDAALANFRDTTWRDPAQTLLGPAQERWLAAGLSRSAGAGKPWQVLAQEVVLGPRVLPPMVEANMPAAVPGWVRDRVSASVAAGRQGLPWGMDSWDGYPAARDRLYAASLAADANLLVLAGDSHNAWAFDLEHQGERVGVEMAGHSVTSPGAESELPWIRPDALAAAMVSANPQLKWCDTAQRGYLALELTPQAATGEWRFLTTIRTRNTELAGTRRMTVRAGQRKFESG
jgi:alkaline phosphatase D